MTNHLGETPQQCANKLRRYSDGGDGARIAALRQLLYYRRTNNEELVAFYAAVLLRLSL